ncbi:hypothetical protein [Mycobacterium sp. 1245111.1]|uniref:hypothetical protein n=1 Tax=Mycobacterium sp. 1245111.1 TaxID=1834073 RepID=UPI000A44ACD5|nr:hypothetical protein [Mycobacterium sp. 1245111.1]
MRSIGWEATGDGEFPYRCDVAGVRYSLRVNDFPAEPLYSLMADGVVLADLDDWPSAWLRPAMPARLRRVADREIRRLAERGGRRVVDLDRIVEWAARLCTISESSVTGVVDALGIPGSVEHRSTGSAVVEPPPLGTLRISIGKTWGLFSDLEVQLAVSTARKHDLDARFGEAARLPSVHPDRPIQFAYRVARPDAPHSVTVFARFGPSPQSALLSSVLLRRETPPHGGVPTL